MNRLKLDWKTVAVGVLGAFLSLLCWEGNKMVGRVEAAEEEVIMLDRRAAVLEECILQFRADQKETLERVKRIEQLELNRGGK